MVAVVPGEGPPRRADGRWAGQGNRTMASQVGPGPVFLYESLIFARRWQVYAGRVLFVLAILIGLSIAWWNNVATPGLGQPLGARPGTLQALARAGASFFYALAGIQLSMVLVVAPAATAGALCQDRAGHPGADGNHRPLGCRDRAGQALLKAGADPGAAGLPLPVLSLAALLGGIEGEALVGLFAVSAAVAVLGCALALAISVEVVKTDEVVVAVLAFTTCWLLSLPVWGGMARAYGLPPPPDWFYATNPFVLIYAPYTWPGHFGLFEVAIFVITALVISAGLLAMTIARLRRFVLPAEVVRRKRHFHLPATGAVHGSANGWRDPGAGESGCRGRRSTATPCSGASGAGARPSRMAQILWVLYWLGAVLATAIGIYDVFAYGIDNMTGGFMIHTALVLQSVLGLMLLSVQAPTALGEERVRGSLDVLMAAPISTRAIVWGKWMGTYRIALGLAVLPGVAAAVIAATSARRLAALQGGLGPDPDRAAWSGRSRARPRAGRRRAALLGRRVHQPGAAPGDLDPPDRPRHRHQSRRLPLCSLRLDVPGRDRHPAGVARLALQLLQHHGRQPILDRPGRDGLSPIAAPDHDHPGAGHRLRRPLAVLDHHVLLVPAGLGSCRVVVLGRAAVVR